MSNDARDARSGWRTLLVAAASATALAIGVVGGDVTGPRLRAQAPTAAAGGPTFEVASIKPNKSGDRQVMMNVQPGGRFTASNVTLTLLIRQAYQVQPFQVIGGPGWLESEHFDIVAKAEGDVPFGPPAGGGVGPLSLMMRALLVDRFKLAVHTESRESQVYAMVLARSDGKLGAGLRPVSAECAAMIAARARGGPPPAGGPGGPGGPGAPGGPGRGPLVPPSLPQPGEKAPCGMMRVGPATLSAGGSPLSQLVTMLSQRLNRVVIDKTGLAGNYEMELQWTPDDLPTGRGDVPPGLPAIDPNGPSLFTAVQEQLGLKLESQRALVDVLVIDHLEPPTED